MTSEEGKYNIKAVSKMLGIQPGTLRAWERRYQMVAPSRNESGHRLYTERHVKILKWLITKVNQGFTISQAVSLLENSEANVGSDAPFVMSEDNQVAELTEKLLNALLQFDETKAQEVINEAFSLFTIDKVLVDILGTLLVKIGDLWENGKITTAHEHYATAILRSRIGIILHSFPHNSFLPKVVAVCGPGEWHELGLLIFTVYLKRQGFEVVYLGSSIAENDIDIVINSVKPKFIFMSCTMKENMEATLEVSSRLVNKFPDISVGLGGVAIDHLPARQKEQYRSFIVGTKKEQWEEWIKERM